MLFHLFIFFSHMNWSIHSYSEGKLTIRMIHVHSHTMSLIGKHARVCMKLGHMPSMWVDTFFVFLFLYPFSHPSRLFPSQLSPTSVSILTFCDLTVTISPVLGNEPDMY